jgi:hypothetical protein
MNKSNDDMLALSCVHDKNDFISYSCCVTNNVEETKDSIGQDKILIEASSNSSYLSHSSHIYWRLKKFLFLLKNTIIINIPTLRILPQLPRSILPQI